MKEAGQVLPVYKVQDGCMISVRGDLTLGFRVSLPEIFTLSERDYQNFHQSWVKALKVLPENSVFHKQDWFTADRYRADFGTAEGFLARASERFFNERGYLAHACYVYLTARRQGAKPSSSSSSGLFGGRLVGDLGLSALMQSAFLDAAGQFAQILNDSGLVSLARLSDDELAGTANAPGVIERYCFLLAEGEASGIADIHLREDLRVGEKRCGMFTLADAQDLPSLCGPRINYDRYCSEQSKFPIGFASPLGLLLDCNHILNQYVFIGEQGEAVKRLEAKKRRLHSLSAYSRENASTRDWVNEFLAEAVSSGRQPVRAHVNVLAWTDGQRDAGELKNLVGAAMAKMDAVCKRETDGQAQIWYAGIPGNAGDFPINDTFETFLEQACCLVNLETSYRSSLSPFGLRMGDRLSGRPLHVDISDEPMERGWITNRSKFILGPSGSGKSFFTNHLLRSYYEQGADIVVVDIGHSYKGLCELVGGYYFTYSESDPIRFNPFYIPPGEELDTEKKESIKTLLLALWKKDDEPYRRSEYVAISGALTGYYAFLSENRDIFPCFDSFYEYLMEHYLEVLQAGKVKEKEFDVSSFLYVLNPYYRGGEFDYLLNARENLDLLHERFIVFEIDVLKDHQILFPVVTLIIMEMVISKMRKLKGIRKIMLLEEVWKAIAKEGMAEYIKYLFKTMRKFFGEPIVVTQEIDDIISSPVVRHAIINNSDCKILLDQSKYQNRFDQIQQLLGLTEKDKALILSMNKANEPGRKYKEVTIVLGDRSKVYRTEVSLEEYFTYTTEEREKVLVARYADRYGGMEKGIAMLAREMRSGTGPFSGGTI
jgi:conjugation system TraG family ATPase